MGGDGKECGEVWGVGGCGGGRRLGSVEYGWGVFLSSL